MNHLFTKYVIMDLSISEMHLVPVGMERYAKIPDDVQRRHFLSGMLTKLEYLSSYTNWCLLSS